MVLIGVDLVLIGFGMASLRGRDFAASGAKKTLKPPPLRGRDFAASGAKKTRKVPPLRGRDFAASGAKNNPFPDPFWGHKCPPKPPNFLAFLGSEFLAKRQEIRLLNPKP